MDPEALPLLSLTTALGAGLLIGLVYERRKSDDPAVAAGLRTHTLASLLGAIATWLGAPVFLVVLLMVGAFAALSYLRTAGHDAGVTAEAALVCSCLLGGLAMREPGAAGALAVLVAILIQAKARLHRFSRELISNREVTDGLVLLAFALIVLPLLPDEPIGPYGALNLATVWKLVVLVMGVGALGHVALRVAGRRWGLLLSGFFAGYVSSTAATASFGQRATEEPARRYTAVGAVMMANLASLSLFVPILLAIAPDLLPRVASILLSAGCVLALGALLGVHRGEGDDRPPRTEARMFRIGQAIGLAALISAVLIVSHVAGHWLGPEAALATTIVTAFAELQAASATIATLFRDGTIELRQAQWAVAGVLLASSTAKSVVAFVSGGRRFGLPVAIGLMSASVAGIVAALVQASIQG